MSVMCECRIIEDKFINTYNIGRCGDECVRPIGRKAEDFPPNFVDSENALVVSDWYRTALAITDDDPELIVDEEPDAWSYRAARAGCQHPDTATRLATQLGILSTWLGVSGLLFAFPIPDTLNPEKSTIQICEFVVSVVLGIVASFFARGIKR